MILCGADVAMPYGLDVSFFFFFPFFFLFFLFRFLLILLFFFSSIWVTNKGEERKKKKREEGEKDKKRRRKGKSKIFKWVIFVSQNDATFCPCGMPHQRHVDSYRGCGDLGLR